MTFCAQTQKTFSLLGGSPSRETEFYVDLLVLPFEPNAQTVCSYSTNTSTSLYICTRGKKNSAVVFYFRRSRRKATAASWFVQIASCHTALLLLLSFHSQIPGQTHAARRTKFALDNSCVVSYLCCFCQFVVLFSGEAGHFMHAVSRWPITRQWAVPRW